MCVCVKKGNPNRNLSSCVCVFANENTDAKIYIEMQRPKTANKIGKLSKLLALPTLMIT